VLLGDGAGKRREISTQELAAILSGIELDQVTRRKRYHRST
jgi:hypothetical protein